jgi:Niemann-Pick C1 protein
MASEDAADKRNLSQTGHSSSHDASTLARGEENVPVSSGETAARSLSHRWSSTIGYVRHGVVAVLQRMTSYSARNPKRTMVSIVVLSLFLLVVGLFTGFTVDVDEDTLWTPTDSKSVKHNKWILHTAGYPEAPRSFVMLFHRDGADVLTGSSMVDLIFTAIDTVRSTPNYDTVCAASTYVNQRTNQTTCQITGVTNFWLHDTDAFRADVDAGVDIINSISARTFPDGTPVSEQSIFGYPERDVDSDRLTSVVSYMVSINLPETEAAEEFETDALDAIEALEASWKREKVDVVLEVQAERSFSDEFTRAIVKDIPLVPAVFVIMSIFTCALFTKRDKVRSQALLGFTAVCSVFLAILSGYGLLFICAVPFTSMTQILPFIIFGVGLDDAYILTGAFNRTNPNKTPEQRMEDTIEEVGLSITVTTVTSAVAFGLSSTSSIPAVRWLCLYAFPTIILVLAYQVTFYVAAMILDQKRIEAKRRDYCTCIAVQRNGDDESSQEEIHQAELSPSKIDSWMTLYAEFLMKPVVKIVVVAAFLALAGLSGWSASKLTQEFDFTDVMPADSYVTDFVDALELYSIRSAVETHAYFRGVDQSDPNVQSQMEKYVMDLVNTKDVTEPPENFWLKDFKSFVNASDDSVQTLPFNDQLTTFLAQPVYLELYRDHIIRDSKTGDVVSSRVLLTMDGADVEDVKAQVQALEDQYDVAKAQPVNKGRSDWLFFSYDEIYNIWEFYSASVDELIMNTVYGVASVAGVAFIFIPHWTASLFVFPLICMLYIDMLGALQWAGIHVNAVSYVTLVMSIGLLVDFVIHIILRYYESPGNRREKTVETLRSMGSSILIGGVSTFLGTLPLAFSTSEIFYTVFVAFLALVTIGVGHGLILVPVILSTIGPEDQLAYLSKHKAAAIREAEFDNSVTAADGDHPCKTENVESGPDLSADPDGRLEL